MAQTVEIWGRLWQKSGQNHEILNQILEELGSFWGYFEGIIGKNF
jgi:hypothetical protein